MVIVVGVVALLGLYFSLRQPPSIAASPAPAPVRPASAAASTPAVTAAEKPASPPPPFSPAPIVPEGLAKLKKLMEIPSAVPNEAVLTFKNAEARKRFMAKAASLGLRVLASIDALNAVRVGYDDLGSLHRYLTSAGSGADAPIAEPHHYLGTPPLQKAKDNQGGNSPEGIAYLNAINASGDRSTWGAGVTVAVLDSGIMAHPTFDPAQVTHIDLVMDGKTMHSHGTSVASLIAGQDGQVPGVAPAAKLLDIRIANDKGMSVSTLLAQGIIEAVGRGAQVINISLGGYDESQVLRRAVQYAQQKGAIIVAAAGNDAYQNLAYPAAYDSVISVGSVDKNSRQAYFSNSGNGLDIAAPGVGLPVAWETDKAASASGTSQSAGVVSGAVAAYLSWGVPARDISRLLRANARATGAPPAQVGSGIVWLRR
jgi:thermitase